MSIEAMKQAMDALEDLKKFVTDDGAMPEHWDAHYEKQYYALEALRQAIEQAEKQEPHCWITPDGEGFRIRSSPPVTNPPLRWIALYEAPPCKEWVGLTDEEISDLYYQSKYRSEQYDGGANEFARAIEAKLKEKNT